MDRQLTENDVALYSIEFITPQGASRTEFVNAAYDATEPGWLVLKDHEHRVVARFTDRTVLMVTRGARRL